MKKFLSLLLALLMLLSLAACGGDSGNAPIEPDTPDTLESEPPADDPASGKEVTGGADGFGDFASIMVPEDFTFERDSWNEDNPHFVSVKRSDFAYFDFHNYTDEESMLKNYDYNKRTYTNEQIDVSADYGGIEWTGFQYGDGMGGYGFEAYAIMGSNYLQVSSAGFAFDHEIAAAVLGSVIMADYGIADGGSVAGGTDGNEAEQPDTSGVDRTDTEVGGGSLDSIDWLSYWTGDWYGWWLITDGTGTYEEITPGVWDACARIEAYESMYGYMELWDSDGGSSSSLIAGIDLSFANPDDTEFGVMCCRGGQFLSATIEDDAWYVNPEELSYENIFDFTGEYVDEYGTFSYRVLLRPWNTVWDDLGEEYYPEHYYDWYIPLINAGESMPDTIG